MKNGVREGVVLRDGVGGVAMKLRISIGCDGDKALCVGATVHYSLVTGMANCGVYDWAGPVVNAAH